MKTKYTQGPWRVVNYQDKNDVPRVVSDKGGIAVLCINRYLGETGPSKQEQTNAALIASAPDLLEALKALVADLKPYMGQGRMDDKIRNAIAAIAKATGE
ncbi:MAG: hypothetical protein MOGMAGMI_01900 [Candidatus Omnitrophica bacterium]|nr:hypothetical protein [Candidatus Omnitrophota bacterium]